MLVVRIASVVLGLVITSVIVMAIINGTQPLWFIGVGVLLMFGAGMVSQLFQHRLNDD